MTHYFVVCYGHISFFHQYEEACQFAKDFDGKVFNSWGLTHVDWIWVKSWE